VRPPAALSHVRPPDLAAAPSHVRPPDPAAAPSHVRRPDPAAAPSPVRGTEPVAGASSHVRQPDPAAAPSHVRQPDPAAEPSHVRGPDVAFLLSAPRSGSTLLRLILAGHPALHCGPELNLLHHETLGDWRRARLARFGAASGVVEGLLRELRIPAAAFDPCEPIRLTYRRLRDAVAPGLLVDKTPSYTKGLGLLLRAEGLFARPRYVHLVRHPLAVIDSFVRQRFHVLIPQEGLDPHAAAERVWAERNRNVLALRARIGPARVHCLRFEDLVRDPRATLAPLCAFLGVDLHEALFEPFAPGRGAGGPGDYGVLDRDALDPSLAEAWRRVVVPRDLAPDTWSLAERFGYPRP
ncbi:MAG: sulfotransferase, partial [Planctomycetota bacterium]